uniref:Uncharacterized protein n=1 Tax=Cacopsylla melanoneura TaxID=428564 RepID=A0A8D8ZC74_9HEMI
MWRNSPEGNKIKSMRNPQSTYFHRLVVHLHFFGTITFLPLLHLQHDLYLSLSLHITIRTILIPPVSINSLWRGIVSRAINTTPNNNTNTNSINTTPSTSTKSEVITRKFLFDDVSCAGWMVMCNSKRF